MTNAYNHNRHMYMSEYVRPQTCRGAVSCRGNLKLPLKRLFKPRSELSYTFQALSQACRSAFRIPHFQLQQDRYIILSDVHKGDRSRGSDDFQHNDRIYCKALDYYLNNDFRLVLNGDIEEGWKSSYSDIIEAYGDTAYHLERQFAQRGKDYYLRTYGNHDIDWANPAMVDAYLKPVIGQPVAVHSGVLLGDQMFITHGHQGDLGSDRNIWLSRRVVRHLWGPLQNMFLFKINRAAENSLIRRNRDKFLQQWGKANRLMVIAGHTHRPMLHPFPALKNLVQFSSGNGHNTVPDLNTLFFPEDGVDPTMYYINDGCCVHSDGITGIEIDRGVIRLVKWATTTSIAGRNGSGMCGISQIVRSIFRSTDLETLLAAL